MSSDIIYHQLALRFDKDITGTPEDLYAIVTQIAARSLELLGIDVGDAIARWPGAAAVDG